MKITKSHVEEMKRVYGFTEITIETHLEGFGSKYIVLLNTNEGKYVLKGMYNRDVKFFITCEYLKKHEYPYLINIRRSIDKRLFIEHEGVICYVYDYIYGENLNTREDLYSTIGTVLAELHSIEVDKTLPTWDVESIFNDIRKDRIPYVPLHYQPFMQECLEHFTAILSLPHAIIHGDLGGSNGIVNARDRNITLIDWDGCGVAPRLIELGNPLFGLLSDDLEFHWENAKELIKAYLTQIRLTIEEKNDFIYAILLISFNNVLFGDTEVKLKKFQWFVQNEDQLKALLLVR